MSFLKELIHVAHPLGFAWLVIGLWLARQLWKREHRRVWIPGIAWLVLTLFTCTPIASLLLLGLEDQYPPVTIADAPTVDAIICLGGGASPSFTEPMRVNFNSSVDRIASSLGLLAQGKAPVMILTGGGYKDNDIWHSEADSAVAYLKGTLKLPHDIVSLGVCRDTHDEALKIADLAKQKGWKKVILVTSAGHMPRAAATFKKVGVDFLPFPCDYVSSFRNLGKVRWLHPPTGAQQGMSVLMHEIIGLGVYWMRGWI